MHAAAGPHTLVVGIGECRTARPPTALSTVALGSCVAVMAWDWKIRLGGMLHVMLPDSGIDPRRAAARPHVFVDTGVPELLRSLIAQGCLKKRLSWCLAGGATMMAGSAHFETGKRNELALRQAFARLGLYVDEEDLGGSESRSVRFDLHSGQILVRAGKGQATMLRRPAAVRLD